MERTYEERNHNDWKKALRKQKIVHNWLGRNQEYYSNLHQYMDNKIHCSCPLCANKTNSKGKRGSFWAKPYNPPSHDIKQIEDMHNQLDEIEKGELTD